MKFHESFIPLDKTQHSSAQFNSGQDSLDQFLKANAYRNRQKGLSATWVLIDEHHDAKKKPIIAYFTLAFANITQAQVPTTDKLPNYPVPVVLIARLAVDKHYQGQGLGSATLLAALSKAYALTQGEDCLPAYAVVLDALDEKAMAFYQHFKIFSPITDLPNRLFVGMKTIQNVLSQL